MSRDRDVVLTAREIEGLRELLEVAPELLELARFKRAEQAAIAASLRLGRGSDVEERSLVFRPPTIANSLRSAGGGHDRLRFRSEQAVTVLKTGGKWLEKTDIVTSTQLKEAERAYLGGRIHPITEQEARELKAAGYSPEWFVKVGAHSHYEEWHESKEEVDA